LQTGEFTIFTDQKSLIHLNEQRLHTPWQQKVFTKLLGLHYKVIYKPGAENRVADALFRRTSPHQLPAISGAVPQWLDSVVASNAKDTNATELITKLSVQPDSVPNYTFSGGVLMFKNRLWVGNDMGLQQQLIAAMHSSALGGHSGIPATYNKLNQFFYWPGLKKVVHTFVRSCTVCNRPSPTELSIQDSCSRCQYQVRLGRLFL
jgi:hypothetical protein